jgi:hypothetical protein
LIQGLIDYNANYNTTLRPSRLSTPVRALLGAVALFNFQQQLTFVQRLLCQSPLSSITFLRLFFYLLKSCRISLSPLGLTKLSARLSMWVKCVAFICDLITTMSYLSLLATTRTPSAFIPAYDQVHLLTPWRSPNECGRNSGKW